MSQNSIDEAAKAMAGLYAWDCVVSILEGASSPDRVSGGECEDVQKVIKIANKAKLRLLNKYDRAAARAANEQS